MKNFPHLHTVRLAAGLLLVSAFISCANVPKPGKFLSKKEPEPKTVDFTRDIRPLLEAKCLSCHHSGEAKRGLNLETLKSANTSWRGGPVVVAKQPERSVLVQVLSLDIDRAPVLSAHRVTYAERERLSTRIREGADWPADLPPLVPR